MLDQIVAIGTYVALSLIGICAAIILLSVLGWI